MKFCFDKFTDFSMDELIFILNVLNDSRAWGVYFEFKDKNPDIILFKKTTQQLVNMFGKKFDGFSVCDYSKYPIKIYFNKQNWDAIPLTSQYKSLSAYRTYLVLHEFGHALGYHKHDKCTKENAPASVMMQQTLSVYPCYPDPWVKKQ